MNTMAKKIGSPLRSTLGNEARKRLTHHPGARFARVRPGEAAPDQLAGKGKFEAGSREREPTGTERASVGLPATCSPGEPDMTNPDLGRFAVLPETSPDLARLLAEHGEQEARKTALRPANKQALFDGLLHAGIAYVTVTFDGSGDSGQIEDIDARNPADETVPMPPAQIVLAGIDWQSKEAVERRLSLEQAIEEMVYDFLSDTHGGWENNDGADGEFCFDARARTIHLDFNERFTSSELYTHDF
jgi:hypothetical protein